MDSQTYGESAEFLERRTRTIKRSKSSISPGIPKFENKGKLPWGLSDNQARSSRILTSTAKRRHRVLDDLLSFIALLKF